MKMTATMKTKKNPIVCGTDFSIHATEAANVAAAMAKRLDTALVLVHVEEHGGLGASHPEIFDAVQKRTRERLAAEAKRLFKSGATVIQKVLSGAPYQALGEAATTSDARLVVVASIGRVAPSRLLAGSVAERTAETSPVPTLVVRDGAPLLSWARGERRLNVLVGCDFSASADAALRWLRELQDIGPCTITVAHVDWPPQELRRLGLHGPVSLTETLPQVEGVLHKELKERVAVFFGEQRVSLCVMPGWGRTDAHLIRLAKDHQADLLVVGTNQRHGLSRLRLGSVSRGVLHHAPMSVVVVPEPPTPAACADEIPEFKRVLVTTDFSAVGDRAVPFAYAALPRGGSVKLIHVVPPWELPGPLVTRYQPKRLTRKQQKQLAAGSLRKLRALIPGEAAARGITTETEVIEQHDVPAAIGQAAEGFAADLICLGSHGRSRLRKALLGSVAQKVMAHCTRPVLVVRTPPS